MPAAWIALGSNLGDPPEQLRSALRRIEQIEGVKLAASSGLYRSAPLGPPGQDDYCNAVCRVDTRMAPADLWRALRLIEDAAGRDRTGAKWGPRTLDLDLLVYDGVVMDTPALTLPHPQVHRRNFVLAPLAEIDPELVIPGRGKVSMLLQGLGRGGLASWPT